MNDKKPLNVFSKRIAYQMRLKGFKCIGTKPNPKFPDSDIYMFEDTPEAFTIFKELTTKAKEDNQNE